MKWKNLKQGTTALRFATETKPVSFYMIHNVLHEKKVTRVTKFLNLDVFLLVTVKFNPFHALNTSTKFYSSFGFCWSWMLSKSFACRLKNLLYVERKVYYSAIYLKISNVSVRKTVLKNTSLQLPKLWKWKLWILFLKKFRFIQMRNTWLYIQMM